MQVLLTGARGDVGRGVRQVLERRGINIISVSRDDWDLNENAPASVRSLALGVIISLVDGEKQITNIVSLAKAQHVRLFIYMSSLASVFPFCAYSKLKNASETRVIRLCKKYKIKCVVIRPTFVVDAGNKWDFFIRRSCLLTPLRLCSISSIDVGNAVYEALYCDTELQFTTLFPRVATMLMLVVWVVLCVFSVVKFV